MNRRYIAMPDSIYDPHGFGHEMVPPEQLVQVSPFPDGETAITIPSISPDDDVVLIGSCHSAQAAESFLAAAYEVAHQGPARFTIANLYFRHARCERKFGNQAVLAKFQARQWSGVGAIYPGVRMVFLHLHNDLALSYFEGPVRVSNVPGLPALEKRMLETELWDGLVVHPDRLVYATVDHGGVYETRRLAEARGVGFAHIDKKRISGTETEVREVHGDVAGRDVVIFDDMISTGGSLIKAAQAYTDRGANRVFAVATHGLFVNNAIPKLAESCVEGVLVTNSHPNAVKAKADARAEFINVYHLEPWFLAPK